MDRRQEAKNFLYTIMRKRGTIYTLGVCIGILMRLSTTDYQLFKELEQRAQGADQ